MSTTFAYDSGANPVTQPLLTANQSVYLSSMEATSITAGSNGVSATSFTTGSPGTLNVTSTAAFVANPAANLSQIIIVPGNEPVIQVETSTGLATISYTGWTSTTFTGCVYISGNGGTFATGGAVTNPESAQYVLTGIASILAGSVFSDQAGTLTILQSFDGTNWDIANTVAVTAGVVNAGISQEVIGPYLQILYTNGSSAQGVFRVHIRVFGTGRQG